MKHVIAVEPDLTPVKEFLSDKGYTVESIKADDSSKKDTGKYDAFIVSGLDSNSFGIYDTSTKAVVISADGLTPEQVYQELKQRLS